MSFQTAWIQDCSKEEAARRLLGYCAETNEPVTGPSDCSCPAHSIASVGFLRSRVANLTSTVSDLNDAAQQSAAKLASVTSERNNLDAKVTDLSMKLDIAQTDAQRFGAKSDSAASEAADLRQQVTDLTRQLRDVTEVETKASDKLDYITAVLKELLA